MKELYLKATKAYIDMLNIHIDTKTLDTTFHKETEVFYETLFKVTHEIGEKYVDLGGHISDSDIKIKKQDANKIIEELKKDIENYKENSKISLGTEDLLGTLANDLENIEGTSKSFI